MRRIWLVVVTMLVAAVTQAQVPNFIAPAWYATGGSSLRFAAGDFNGDGHSDVVTYEWSTQTLTISFANADGTFQAPVSRSLGFSANSITAADFNGDGKADLALATGNFVAVLINAGDGTFAPAAFYNGGVTANYVTAADFDHDGKLDLAVAGGFGVGVIRGLGNGAFAAPFVMSDTFSHSYIVAADFNNDGNIDIVADGAPAKFYAGNGDGTFAAPVLSASMNYGAVAADFNGDGKLDFAYTETTFTREQVQGQHVAIVIGTGDGHFLSYMDIMTGGDSRGAVAAGDFNGDGIADLAIYLSGSPSLRVLFGGALGFPNGITVDPGFAANSAMISADIDGNGSPDLLLMSASSITAIRNTHGNPPLLASASLNPSAVVGGANTQGTVTLGGPAPAGGALVAITSSNPDLAYPVSATVAIPEGQSSGSFSIQTLGVASATPVTFSAAWNGIAQNAVLNVVAPYNVTGLTISPSAQYGIFTSTGTVTLSGPADSSAVVLLTSSNSALASVPASVVVPAGATSASFTIALQPVAADTAVSIGASLGGVSQSASITVLHPLDVVKVTKADDVVSKFQLRVEATSTSAVATLTAWNAANGAFIGTMQNAGGGKYVGQFTVSPVLNILLKSSLGGSATGAVTQK